MSFHIRPLLAALGAEIVGMDPWARVPHEGQSLIRALTEFASRPEFPYRHRRPPGDAELSDNRCTQHCAMPFDDTRHHRLMRRTTREGHVPAYGDLRAVAVAAG